jgi:hypothetical protein
MGLFDVITGKRRLKAPAADRMFAITTASVTLEAAGISSTGAAAIVFQNLSTADFTAAVKDMEELVSATGADSGLKLTTPLDAYGYRWLVLKGPTAEDTTPVENLAVSINAVSSGLETSGYGDRLLCAVFAFREGAQPVNLIYNYKRGSWYPFVPAPGAANERVTQRELELQAQLGAELPLEPEITRWFPLWGIPL